MIPMNTKLSFSVVLLTALLTLSASVSAQGFDPATVDWEKIGKIPMKDMFIKKFNKNCAGCHGEDLRGATLGPPLVGDELRYGDSVEELVNSIANGTPGTEMPAWKETMKEQDIYNLALYIAEKRQGTTILDKNDGIELAIPEGVIETQKASFVIETVATGIDALPFSIAPLPEGGFLLSERKYGLSFIDAEGNKTAIENTPTVYADTGMFLGQVQGLGWMLEVALHPDYEDNGWVYLHYTDRCSGCNELSKRGNNLPVSMNRVVRGRIEDNRWIDEELIWEADKEHYTNTSDLAAAGRLTFDDEGYVYFSVGMKDTLDVMGIQDLSKPYGKLHRMNDDGRLPEDNPFVDTDGAIPSIYALGLRSVQGLAFNEETGELWTTEMGPRGGDELNRIKKGGNYGWPIFTNGINYDGRPIKLPKDMKVELTEEEAIFPVVDWTPAVAISNLRFYDSDEFPEWQGNIIAGTLRATDLLRLEVEDGEVVHTEVLIENLARFRDVKLGPDGELYLLLEHKTDSQIIRLKAAD